MSDLSVGEMVLRLFLATLAGAMVGCERETRGRPAGLRTTILACVAAAAAMIISESFAFHIASFGQSSILRADPGRIPMGVLTGIGFLGAGTILRHEGTILGVTTAASLWFVTVLGLAFGGGQFTLGFLGVGIALGTLYLLPLFEKRIRSDRYSTLTVTARLESLTEEDLRSQIEAFGPRILSMKVTYDLEKGQKTITFPMQLARRNSVEVSSRMLSELKQHPGILRLEWD